MNLKETFNKELLPQLQEKLGIDNVMAVPKLWRIAGIMFELAKTQHQRRVMT